MRAAINKAHCGKATIAREKTCTLATQSIEMYCCDCEWLLARINRECQTAHEKPKSEKSKSGIELDKDIARKTRKPEKAKSRQVKKNHELKSLGKKATSRKNRENSQITARSEQSKSAARREKSQSQQPPQVEKYSGRLQVEKSTSRNVENYRKSQKSTTTLSKSGQT